MNRLFFSVMIFTTLLFSWDFKERVPLELITQIISPDKLTTVSLYKSNDVSLDEGELPHQYIKISTLTGNSWLSSTDPTGTNIVEIQFIDNGNILLVQRSFTVSQTSVVNLNTHKVYVIGWGEAKYITQGKDSGLFLVSGVKRYFPEGGAYWVDELRDKNGNLIEILSKPKNEWGCIQLKKILDTSKKYPYLKQSFSDCVYVER